MAQRLPRDCACLTAATHGANVPRGSAVPHTRNRAVATVVSQCVASIAVGSESLCTGEENEICEFIMSNLLV